MSADPADKDRERARAWAETEDAHEAFTVIASECDGWNAQFDAGYPLSNEDLWLCAAEGAERGHAQGQADERARIVAALRRLAGAEPGGPVAATREGRMLADAADALERGEL